MDRPVRWTRIAVDDLDDIASYIARELPFKGYRLLYEIHDDAIYIAGLIHGARELSRAWADRGRPGDPDNA